MRKQKNNNQKTKVIFISLAIISSFLFIINFIPIFFINAGITTEFTGNLRSDRIAYVNQSDPDTHFYDTLWSNAVIGNSCETYVHYNLDLLPRETKELYFFIEYYDYGPKYWLDIDDVEINLILVESEWNSSEITWNNKPLHEGIISSVNASKIRQGFVIEYYNLEKAIDLTEIYKEKQLKEISFCINITENNEGLDANVYLYDLQLLWNYERLLISYTAIISSIIIFSMFIGIIFYIRKDISLCSNCNKRRKITEKFCSSCGKDIENNVMIKSSDYLLILILLWVFAFLEVSFLILFIQSKLLYIIGPLLVIFVLIPWIIFCYLQISQKIKKYKEIKLSMRNEQEFSN